MEWTFAARSKVLLINLALRSFWAV